MKNFLTRTLSGIVMVAIIIAMVYKGGRSLEAFVLLISIIGIREFYDAFKETDIKPIKGIGYLATILFYLQNLEVFSIELSFIFFVSMIIALFKLVFDDKIKLEDVAITLFGIIYVPFFFQHIVYLDGYKHIWLVFIIAWGTDTFAYLAGNLFGKTKLSPKLSPNKTVEGSLGGILGSVLLTFIFSKAVGLESIPKLLVLAVVCSIISQLGDLTASRVKRITGIKDFGYIIPGHGGILDRFDSILFVAPCIYYFMKLFII